MRQVQSCPPFGGMRKQTFGIHGTLLTSIQPETNQALPQSKRPKKLQNEIKNCTKSQTGGEEEPSLHLFESSEALDRAARDFLRTL